mgnify:FL=1
MNLEEYHITKASGSKYQIELLAVFCGPDLSVTICGGTGYHVGAIALGCARPIKEGRERSATVSVICAYEHKDDEAARQSAKYLATTLKCRVSVAAGIHVDNASEDELDLLMKNSEDACRELVRAVMDKSV